MNQKPRLVIIINSLAFGGAERVVALLINELYKTHEVHLVLFSNIISYDIPPEIKVKCLHEKENSSNVSVLLKLPLYARELSKYCRQNKIDTSISFLNRPCYVNALMRSWFGYKGKVIMCERSHQSSILNYIGGGSELYKKLTKKLIRYAYNKADKVLTNSKLSAADLQTNFAVKKPISVVYNPLNIQKVEQLAQEPLQLDHSNDFYFVATGNFRIEKNFPLLLKAFSTLKDLPVKLLLVGGGKMEATLKDLANELGINEKVIFAGYQQNPYRYMAAGNCFVLSSFTEGFPNVLLEALACGKTVVSTDCKSGPREILAPRSDINKVLQHDIEEAEFGILVHTEDEAGLAKAMRKVFDDTVLRERYETHAPARAKQFDINVILPQFLQYFSE